MTITLTVTKRIATISATERIVAGNTYPIALALDSEWTGSLFMRVRFGSQYYDIPFASSDASVNVQFPVGYPEVGIGVFSEALEICTNETRVRLLRSILEQGVSVVEFDSDLYDQWAGEVSELLCDNAFDAESERPVKNSVLTAWKNTVPLDSALVHKTGNESIAGNKTFTSDPIVTAPNYPVLKMDSQQDVSATGIKGEIRMMDRKNGSQSAVSLVQAITNSGYNIGRMSVYNPDKSQAHSIEVRSYSDHQLVTVDAPYYPVDGSSNPQPLTANALITSGNLAVDPRIVHTTGNETVAGDKTFTGRIYGYRVLSKDTSAYGTGNAKCGIGLVAKGENGSDISYAAAYLWQVYTGENKRNSFSINVKSLDGASESSIELWKMADNSTRLFVPSHTPVDGSGNHLAPASGEAMTSAMLAVDPRIVHTTGTETIAGTKNFSGTVNANGSMVVNGDLNTGLYRSAVTSIQQGKWVEFATISDMVEGLFYLTFSDPTNYMNDVRGLVAIICRPSQNIVVFRWIAGRCATPEDFAISTDPTNNVGHVWFMKRGVYGTPCLIRLAEHNYLTPRTRVLNGTDTNNYDEIPVPTGGRVTYSTKEDWMS